MRNQKRLPCIVLFANCLICTVRLSSLSKEKQAFDPGRFGQAKSNRSPVGPLMASVKQSQHRRSGAKAWSDLEGGCLMKRTFVKFAVAGGLAVGMASGAAQAAGGPTDQDILKDAETPGDVLTYGMGTQGQRHSRSRRSTPTRSRSWRRSGRSRSAAKSSAARNRSRSSTTARCTSPAPTRASSRSMPRTGKKLWKYEPACPKASCRAATWSTAAPPLWRQDRISARSTRSSWRSTRTPARSSGRRRSTTTRPAIRAPPPR